MDVEEFIKNDNALSSLFIFGLKIIREKSLSIVSLSYSYRANTHMSFAVPVPVGCTFGSSISN